MHSRTTPSLALLIMVNLIPLVMVITAEWTVVEILLLFWLENVVIGIYNLMKMATCQKKAQNGSKYFLMPFFTIHYGIFTMGHGAIILDIFAANQAGHKLPFGPEMVFYVADTYHLWLPLMGLMISHGFSLVWHYWMGGEYLHEDAGTLMAKPYGRVVVLHVVVLIGGFLVQAMGQPVIALLMLIVLKVLIDANAHQRAHNKNTDDKTHNKTPEQKNGNR